MKAYIRWGIGLVFLVFIWIARINTGLSEWYARTVYPTLSSVLSAVSGVFPFSLGDCFIYGSILGLLIYLVYSLVKRRPVLRVLGRIAEYVAWVYIWFYMAWGLNYFRQDFFARSGVAPAEYSEERFRSFVNAYMDSLNASYVSSDKVDTAEVAREVKAGFRRIAPQFGLYQPQDRLHPKTMLVTPLMSGVGVMGYMGPFSAEYHLNGELLPIQYPSVYAHEMSHLLGIAGEAEANLYSYLVCTQSPVPEIRFSGYFSLLPYVAANANQLLSAEEFNRLGEKLSPEVCDLYNKKSTYWQSRYNPFVGEMQDLVYNWFLKSNNIPSGRQNYSEVIALLMALNSSQ